MLRNCPQQSSYGKHRQQQRHIEILIIVTIRSITIIVILAITVIIITIVAITVISSILVVPTSTSTITSTAIFISVDYGQNVYLHLSNAVCI